MSQVGNDTGGFLYLIKNFPGIIYGIELETSNILFIEGKVEEITGYRKEDFLSGKIKWNMLIYPDDLHLVEENISKFLKNPGRTLKSEYRIISRDRSIKWIMDEASALESDNTIVSGFIQDITENKKIELTLRKNEKFLSSIFNAIQDGLSIIDRDLNIIRVNSKMEELYPHMVPLEGKKCFYAYHRRDAPCGFCPSISAMGNNTLKNGVVPYDNPDGKSGWLELFVYPIHSYEGEVIGAVEHVRDITNRRELEERLRFLSFHDILTGLYNRTFFEEELRRLDTSRSLPLGVMMGDVNGLKLVNDVFGHLEGDKLLIEAGKILKMSCRKEDIVARWGGDEFVVIFLNVTEDVMEDIIERVYKNVQESKFNKIPLSISIGYAIKYSTDQSIEDVLRKAEDNMYERKLLESNSIRHLIIDVLERTLYELVQGERNYVDKVKRLSEKFGLSLNLSKRELDDLRLLARLHDIGKVGILEEGKIKDEFIFLESSNVMKKHPEIGYRIVQSVPELAGIANFVLHHHEHWDGSGYPQGLKGDEIPLLSRMISIVDAYTIMRTEKPYGKGMSKEEAILELKRYGGTIFDPELVEIFIGKVLSVEGND